MLVASIPVSWLPLPIKKLPAMFPVAVTMPAVTILPPVMLPIAVTTPPVSMLPPVTLPETETVPLAMAPAVVKTTTLALPATLTATLPLA